MEKKKLNLKNYNLEKIKKKIKENRVLEALN